MTKYKGNFLDYLNLKTMRSKEYEKAYLKKQENYIMIFGCSK